MKPTVGAETTLFVEGSSSVYDVCQSSIEVKDWASIIRAYKLKALEQSRSTDSSTQIGALTQPGTIDHEVQTETDGETTLNIDQREQSD